MKKILAIINEDKSYWTHILTLAHWVVTGALLIIDRGHRVDIEMIVVIILVGYISIICLPIFLFQRITFLRDIKLEKILNGLFIFNFICSLIMLFLCIISFFFVDIVICLYFSSQGILFWIIFFERIHKKNSSKTKDLTQQDRQDNDTGLNN